jgi:hypothetical protein
MSLKSFAIALSEYRIQDSGFRESEKHPDSRMNEAVTLSFFSGAAYFVLPMRIEGVSTES